MSREIRTEWVMDLHAEVSPPQIVGATPQGERRIIPITGGSFEGPGLRGKVVAGGSDWQIIGSDGVTRLQAHYHLKTDDDVLLTVVNTGMRHGPKEVLDRIAAGEIVDPSSYYFRAIPVMEAPPGKYEWLNKSVFVSSGERSRDGVLIHFFRVL